MIWITPGENCPDTEFETIKEHGDRFSHTILLRAFTGAATTAGKILSKSLEEVALSPGNLVVSRAALGVHRTTRTPQTPELGHPQLLHPVRR